MNKDYRYFADDDSVLEAPDFMKVKILLTMLRKQDAYVHALESNMEALVEKAKELSSQLAHYKKIAKDVGEKNDIIRNLEQQISKLKADMTQRDISFEQQISKLKADVKQRDASLLELAVRVGTMPDKPDSEKRRTPKIISKIDLDAINRPVKKSKEEREKERQERALQWLGL